MPLTDQAMKMGLRALNGVAGLEALDRLGLRKPAERLLFNASKTTAATAARAGRAWGSGPKLGRPARPARASAPDAFDLTPTDEQQILRDSFAAFAAERVRPAAGAPDAACAT